MILIQETEHRIIYSNGMVYSRIIILQGIINLRRVTICRQHPRRIMNPLLRCQKIPLQHQHLYQHPNLRNIRSQQKRLNQLRHQRLSYQKRKIRRNKIKQRKQKKKTRIQVIPKCFGIKKTRGILLNTRM